MFELMASVLRIQRISSSAYLSLILSIYLLSQITSQNTVEAERAVVVNGSESKHSN